MIIITAIILTNNGSIRIPRPEDTLTIRQGQLEGDGTGLIYFAGDTILADEIHTFEHLGVWIYQNSKIHMASTVEIRDVTFIVEGEINGISSILSCHLL